MEARSFFKYLEKVINDWISIELHISNGVLVRSPSRKYNRIDIGGWAAAVYCTRIGNLQSSNHDDPLKRAASRDATFARQGLDEPEHDTE
jgi:hypothetical protein